jgi:hypothetical protein
LALVILSRVRSEPPDWPLSVVKAPRPLTPIEPVTQRPTIAVVIAAYQAAETVAAAIDSALEQTLPPDEIVVCDDGSTDGTSSVLAGYGDRLTVISQRNSGEGAAKNAAVRAASSDFVAILDADDLFMPRRLEAIAELAMARPDLDVITTDVVAEVDGQPVGLQSEMHSFPVEVAAQRAEILRHSFLSCPAIRRVRMLEVGGYDYTLRIGGDWHCWMKLILGGSLVGLIDEPLYRYKLMHGSLGSDPIANHRANAAILERLLGDSRLLPEERAIVARGIRTHQSTARLLDAQQAVLAGRPDARRAALGVVLGRGFMLRSRVKAFASALAPALTRRVLERRRAGSPAHGVDVTHR